MLLDTGYVESWGGGGVTTRRDPVTSETHVIFVTSEMTNKSLVMTSAHMSLFSLGIHLSFSLVRDPVVKGKKCEHYSAHRHFFFFL